ncbi:hypothetical protein [Streptomyces anulatus]|uniref:hypothetical protein n=1 Tax=Streptomyces anulatus TaxID=1892 RepID=UPI0037DCD598|nr:hypothetical protein OHB50_39070 [Streptomyces anulatus]
MTDAQRIAAEIDRLSAMKSDAFVKTVAAYAEGTPDPLCPQAIQEAALHSDELAVQTLDALDTALKQAKSFFPMREGETRKQQFARIEPWRVLLRAAKEPLQDIVDDLAHEHTKELAALDDESFARQWTDFVLGHTADSVSRRIQALAFRSPRVAARAEELCRLMYEDPAQFLPPATANESRKGQAARVEELRRSAESEARFLRYAIQYGEARHGRMPSEPNVRLQALRLLGQAHPEELSKLLNEVGDGRRAEVKKKRGEQRAVRRAR